MCVYSAVCLFACPQVTIHPSVHVLGYITMIRYFLSSSIDMKTQKKERTISRDSQKWQYNRNHEEMLANQKHRNNDMAQSDMRKRHKNIHF